MFDLWGVDPGVSGFTNKCPTVLASQTDYSSFTHKLLHKVVNVFSYYFLISLPQMTQQNREPITNNNREQLENLLFFILGCFIHH